MKKILYGKKPPYPKITEELVAIFGNSNIMPGEKVLVAENTLFKNDIDTPWKTLLRPGTVTKRYGSLAFRIGEDLELGPYPDMIEIEMDVIRPTGVKTMTVFTESAVKISNKTDKRMKK